MPTPLPLPIRVLVKGASTVGWSSPMGDARENLFFPRVIERELLQAGRPALVQTISVPSERTKSTLRHWEDEMIGYSPDVVVLVYGHYETIHLFLPWWLERHVNSLKQRPGKLGAWYRKRVLRPVWMSLAKLQARLDPRYATVRRQRPERVAADLERLIGHIQTLHRPLVYCFELLPPAKRFQSWFPGMARRIEVMNDTLQAMVKRIDRPEVRYFRVAPIADEVAGGDLDVATPDGFHYSVDMHRRIGELLAADIAEWAATQPHLALPPEPAPATRRSAAKTARTAPAAAKTAAAPAKRAAKKAVKRAAKQAAVPDPLPERPGPDTTAPDS